MSIEHRDIPDAQLHEVKGAVSATAGQFLQADGAGSADFVFVDWDDVINKPTYTGYSTTLLAYSSVTQGPTALDTAYQVTFGPAQANPYVSISAAGLLTFLTPGNYQVSLWLRVGRATGTGTSVMLIRGLYNGVAVMNTNSIRLPAQDITVPSYTRAVFNAQANDTLAIQIARDSSGTNYGDLVALTPVIGWNVAPSATIVVNRFVG